MLPMRPGIPERQTYDYVRHGTTAPFDALEIATGEGDGARYPSPPRVSGLLKQVTKA